MTDQTYNVILPDKGVPVEAWTRGVDIGCGMMAVDTRCATTICLLRCHPERSEGSRAVCCV
jgi:hypothetical protein